MEESNTSDTITKNSSVEWTRNLGANLFSSISVEYANGIVLQSSIQDINGNTIIDGKCGKCNSYASPFKKYIKDNCQDCKDYKNKNMHKFNLYRDFCENHKDVCLKCAPATFDTSDYEEEWQKIYNEMSESRTYISKCKTDPCRELLCNNHFV